MKIPPVGPERTVGPGRMAVPWLGTSAGVDKCASALGGENGQPLPSPANAPRTATGDPSGATYGAPDENLGFQLRLGIPWLLQQFGEWTSRLEDLSLSLFLLLSLPVTAFQLY